MISAAVGCSTVPFRYASGNEVWLAKNGLHPRGLGVFAYLHPDRPLSGAYPGQTLDITFKFLNLFSDAIFLGCENIVNVGTIQWIDARGGYQVDFKELPEWQPQKYVRIPGTSETRSRIEFAGNSTRIYMEDNSYFRTRRLVDIPADVGGATSVTVNATFGIRYYPEGSRRQVYCHMEGQYTLAIIANRAGSGVTHQRPGVNRHNPPPPR